MATVARTAADRAAAAALAAAGAVVVMLVALVLTGVRPLVVVSPSMEPAIAMGDLLLVEPVLARTLAVGEVVTFRDPDGDGRTLTHRVVSVRRDGPRMVVTTRGDSNGAAERWSVDPGGTVARTRGRVPRVGRITHVLASRQATLALVVIGSLGLGVLGLRRIWLT